MRLPGQAGPAGESEAAGSGPAIMGPLSCMDEQRGRSVDVIPA